MPSIILPARAVMRVAITSNPPTGANLHVNVFHFARRDGVQVTDADCFNLALAINSNMLPTYRGMFYTDHQITGCYIQGVTGNVKPYFDNVAAWNVPGTRVIDTDPLPAFVCSKISWLTNTGSRQYRGRSYFGGLRESDSNGSDLGAAAATAQTNFQTALVRWRGDSNTDPNFVMVILSDPDNVLPDIVPPAGKREATAAACYGGRSYSQLFTLRRRMIGVGK